MITLHLKGVITQCICHAFSWFCFDLVINWTLLSRVALGAQRSIGLIVKLSRERSVGLSVRAYVRASVCPMHCAQTPDQIRMPFGIIGGTGPGMRQVVGFGNRSTGSGTFGGEFGARHCNQWGLYGVCVR